jgi:1,4-dihydroxy-2-naphthoate octaprenyltransferase
VTAAAGAGAVPARPGSLGAWFLAARPKTLVAGVVPVAVGSGLAVRSGAFAAGPALAALVGALLIQIGTNLANDAFDYEKGADTGARLGPPRATQQGWLSSKAVLRGAVACFALAVLVGLYLVSVAGPALIAVGLVSIVAGYAYTGGPYPLAYHGLGDVFVLVFFGLVATAGSYFVQAHAVTAAALIAGVAVGALGVSLLAVNNTRDAKTDAAAGKRTLVVRFGEGFGRGEWLAMVVVASLVPVVLVALGWATAWALLPLASLVLAVEPARVVRRESGEALNRALAATARFQLVFGVLFAVGLSR